MPNERLLQDLKQNLFPNFKFEEEESSYGENMINYRATTTLRPKINGKFHLVEIIHSAHVDKEEADKMQQFIDFVVQKSLTMTFFYEENENIEQILDADQRETDEILKEQIK